MDSVNFNRWPAGRRGPQSGNSLPNLCCIATRLRPHCPPKATDARQNPTRQVNAISLDLPDLCRPFHGRGFQCALSQEPGEGADRPVGRLRSADPDRLRLATTCWPRARSARSACRSAISATCARCSTGIPLGTMNTSMTINATAAWLMALYIAVADEQGTPRAALTGTIQNDIIKEYLSRGTYVFPPAPSMRLIKDVAIFTTTELPKWNPMNICSYHLQEAGATPVQELAFALATAVAVLDTVKSVGRSEPGEIRRGGRAHFVLRQCRACASSPRCARCAPSSNCGTRSRASATASPTPSSGCSATACR